MKKFVLLAALVGSTAFAQNLPKGLTDDERAIMNDYYQNYQSGNRGITTPPTGDLRCMAEWEEVQTLVITWTGQYNGIHSQIVAAAQQECEVMIVCSDSNNVKTQLTSRGVPLINLTFIQGAFNSVWVRDYAANTMYKNDVDDLFLVDWIYNRPRPADDAMPQLHADKKGIDLYQTSVAPSDMVNTGGNWYTDGFGTAFASELILEENEPGNPYGVTAKTEAQLDAIVNQWMGIDRYIKMTALPYDNINHIDMHFKPIDEETILVGEFPAGISDGPQIEANLQYVMNTHMSIFGTPYKFVRIPMPPSTGGAYPGTPFGNGYYRTYANNVFVNKTVIVPYYRAEYDTIAARILKESLPGYKIVGIDVDNNPEVLISASGAIHCITHTIGVNDPLLISHQRLEDTYDAVNDYLVSAFVKHRSGITSATLYWTTDTTAGYQAVSMSNTATDTWSGYIPAHPVGSKIFYYIQGTAVNGKTQVRPIVAPQGYWVFNVLVGSVSAPGLENEGIILEQPFPNPANAITCIPVSTVYNSNLKVYLTDITGKVVTVLQNGSVTFGEHKYFIDARNYAQGSYFVVAETENARISKPIVIAY